MEAVEAAKSPVGQASRFNWRTGLRFGLLMIVVSWLLLGVGWLVAPGSNLLGIFGFLSVIPGAVGYVAVLASCIVAAWDWMAGRRAEGKPPRHQA